MRKENSTRYLPMSLKYLLMLQAAEIPIQQVISIAGHRVWDTKSREILLRQCVRSSSNTQDLSTVLSRISDRYAESLSLLTGSRVLSIHHSLSAILLASVRSWVESIIVLPIS